MMLFVESIYFLLILYGIYVGIVCFVFIIKYCTKRRSDDEIPFRAFGMVVLLPFILIKGFVKNVICYPFTNKKTSLKKI